MISSVSGVVVGLIAAGVVVRVGGVGLALQTTPAARAAIRVGDEVELATSLVVREDSLTLYGFGSADERDMFELLQTSSGVGPRLAQAVLTVHLPDAVRRALLTEDLAVLCLVPGIGRKGAQRMVLELKDRVSGVGGPPAAAAGGPWRDTLGQALVGLGFGPAAVTEQLDRLAAEHPDAGIAEVPALLRESLAALSRAR